MNKESFLNFLGNYHEAIFPFHFIAFLFGILILYSILANHEILKKNINLILGFLWCFDGFFLFTLYASKLAPFTYTLQGILFPLQGIIFFIQKDLNYDFNKTKISYLGVFILFFGLFIYPIFGNFSSFSYPNIPIFPEPCPLTIFTLGLSLLAKKAKLTIFAIVFFWSFMGIVAVLKLEIYSDIFEVFFGILTFFILFKKQKIKPSIY